MLRVSLALAVGLVTGCRPSDSDVVRRERSEGSGSPQQSAAQSVADERDVIVFLGTSLTAGLGLEDPSDAYPALLQGRIDAAGLPYRVVNAGVSGDTSAGGLDRLDWLLDQPIAVLVLELGANDGLRGLPPEDLRANLTRIVDRTRDRHPDADIVLAGMQAPPNMGPRYTRAFQQVYRDVAADRGLALVPFLLEGVGGVAEYNQADGIHPNPEGHRRVADNVWKVLEPVLRARAARANPGGAP